MAASQGGQPPIRGAVSFEGGPGFPAVAARKVGVVRFFGEINPLPSFFQARCIR
jgi:hypothetical protein